MTDLAKEISDEHKGAMLQHRERRWQKQWYSEGLFETGGRKTWATQKDTYAVDLHKEKIDKSQKFYGTVPLLPMENRLHMGHAFSILQVDFAAGFALMTGKRTLFPIGFQCSGSSIQERADRIKEEMSRRRAVEWIAFRRSNKPPSDFRNRYPESWILHSQGIPATEIECFDNPAWWMAAFPALAKQDLQMLGVRVDWRRSFVTGDCNPFYRSFVQWQVRRLRELGRIKYAKAYTLYSLETGQPCPELEDENGHRMSVAKSIALKLKVSKLSELAFRSLQSILKSETKIYAVCALSSPEYLYGLGCCWVSAAASYGVFSLGQDEYILASHKAAQNMAFQGVFPVWGKCEEAARLNGSDLVGTSVEAPFADMESRIRLLPDANLEATLGTGIFAAFPTENLKDHLKLNLLRDSLKAQQLEKGWVSHTPPATIHVPSSEVPPATELYQSMVHNGSVEDFLRSQKLRDICELAASEAYINGHMLVEKYAGVLVREARNQIRTRLLGSGHAFEYCEPSTNARGKLTDNCVVAYMEHWQLNYGLGENGVSSEWLRETLSLLNGDRFKHISAEARSELQTALCRLSSWAAGKHQGHGTHIPWDDNLRVDPFVEAAIAPAYQTIAHWLHADMYGELLGTGVVRPEQMTDRVWDFVFSRLNVGPKELYKIKTNLNHLDLSRLRLEFEWWYPLDLFAVDGGQLQDHLTFFLFHHVALWLPKNWPREATVTGQLLLEGQKMSGRRGHLVPIGKMTSKYGADAVRMAVARASNTHTLESVEWDETVALNSMRKLYELKDCIERMAKETDPESSSSWRGDDDGSNSPEPSELPQRNGTVNIWDLILMDELDYIMRETASCCKRYSFREALQHAFDETTAALDSYRQMTADAKVGIHKTVFAGFVRTQVLVLAPICPHWCETIWTEVLKEGATIHKAPFPEPVSPFSTYTASAKLLKETVLGVRAELDETKAKGREWSSASFDQSRRYSLTICHSDEYLEWQLDCIDKIRELLGPKDDRLDSLALIQGISEDDTIRYRNFANHLQHLIDRGMDRNIVLSSHYPCEQAVVLRAAGVVLANTLPNCVRVDVKVAANDQSLSHDQRATPGFPTWQFRNLQ